MKIIGERRQESRPYCVERIFIIEATDEEIANLIGFYYTGDSECPKLGPGFEIKVAAMFRRLYSLQHSQGTLEKTAKGLREIADLLEAEDPIVRAAAADEPAVAE